MAEVAAAGYNPPSEESVGPTSGGLRRLARDLRSEIVQRWPAYYPHHVGDDLAKVSLDLRECGYSVIFKARLEFPGRNAHEQLVVKIRREQKYGSVLLNDLTERTLALTRREYEEHLRAFDFFRGRTDGLSVVQPFDLIESHNALVVEHAAGSDVATLVRDHSPLATLAVERCGRWWKLFHHDLHDAVERPWDPAAAGAAALDQRFARIRKFGAPAKLLDSMREEIGRAARRVPPVPVPVSVIHGDCKLRHVWATAERIQVLDFGNTKVGDSWIDPAALVVELSLYSLWSRRFDSGSRIDDIRTLLHAYFDGPPPAAFSLYVVDCLLKKWHRRLRNWGAGAGVHRLRRSLKAAGLATRLERLYIDRWFTFQIRSWLALAEGHPPAWLRPVVE